MAAIPSRHRSLFLLAAVLLVQVLMLAIQIKRGNTGNSSLLRVWGASAASPFEHAGASSVGGIRGIWDHYFALSHTARENDELRRENDALKLQNAQLEGASAEAARLAKLLNFRESQSGVPMVTARVIAVGADANSQVIYLDRGYRDGIRKNMGVITPDGIVGKVIDVLRDSDSAVVLLVTDKDGGAGAMLADSRIQSPVNGNGEPLLLMRYIASDDQVKVGERVVTSGMDRIFPKDLPVGTVVEVKAGVPFKQVRVRPAANLARLEEVVVLLTHDPLHLESASSEDASPGSAEGPAPTTQTPVAQSPKHPASGVAGNSGAMVPKPHDRAAQAPTSQAPPAQAPAPGAPAGSPQ
jgi:rod shape-determining protein MreC